MVNSPDSWFAGLMQKRDKAFAAIREKEPLPAIDGSVDIIPNTQVSLFANKLEYRPRPIFQEYSTYTRELVAANRSKILGNTRPEYILFAPAPIDNRYPALTEGPLWPDLLRAYKPVKVVRKMILLKHRPDGLPDMAIDKGRFVLNINKEATLLPYRGNVLFAKLHIHKSLFGRLAEFLFKSSQIDINVELASGKKVTRRLIPRIAGEGFVLSPYIDNAIGFADIAAGRLDLLDGVNVASIQLQTNSIGSLMYTNSVEMELFKLDLGKLEGDPVSDEFKEAIQISNTQSYQPKAGR